MTLYLEHDGATDLVYVCMSVCVCVCVCKPACVGVGEEGESDILLIDTHECRFCILVNIFNLN